MNTYRIQAIDTRTNTVQHSAEVLGEAYGRTYQTREEAEAAAARLEADKEEYGLESVAYEVALHDG